VLVFVENKPTSEENGGNGAEPGTHVVMRIPNEKIQPAKFTGENGHEDLTAVLRQLNSIINAFHRTDRAASESWAKFAADEFPRHHTVSEFVTHGGRY